MSLVRRVAAARRKRWSPPRPARRSVRAVAEREQSMSGCRSLVDRYVSRQLWSSSQWSVSHYRPDHSSLSKTKS